VILAGVLYYQIQLYPDMFLQIFFFVTNILGWWRWANPKPGEEDDNLQLKISYMKPAQLIILFVLSLGGTALLGLLASHLHQWFPAIFYLPSAYPFVDSFITVMSVLTTFLMIQK